MNDNELHIIYGNKPEKMVKKVLSAIEIEKELKPGMLIGIKPNLILASPSEEGATTSPEIVEGVIRYLKEKGFNNIIILESSWVGARTKKAFKVCGYEEIAERYDVQLYDLKQDSYREITFKDLNLRVCEKALEVDYLINVPVLKAHCQTKLTCALKNLKGCIPDQEKRRFHYLGLHKPIGYLNKVLKSQLIIVDAINGDLTFEEGGNPVQMDRIIVGKDPVLVDSYGASLIGYSGEEIEYIKIAASIGVGTNDLERAKISEYDTNLKNSQRFKHSRKVERLTRKIEARNACSACYGSLIHALKRLEEKGKLAKIDKVYIGQGFRGKSIDGTGIGICTRGFSRSLKGCPPSAREIVEFILDLVHQ